MTLDPSPTPVAEATTPAAPARRQWLLLGGVAALAAAGGAGWAWLRQQERQREQAASRAATAALWPQVLPRPEGGELALAGLQGKPLVLNFWATWCAPCVREMPALDRFAREYGPRGWQVVGLAIDRPDAVRAFLKQTPVSFPVVLAGFEGSELARTLGNAQGGLPFTVVLNARGEIVQRRAGETHLEQLKSWADAV